MIEKKKGKYALRAKGNRKMLGEHKSREAAMRQERAIMAAKAMRRRMPQ